MYSGNPEGLCFSLEWLNLVGVFFVLLLMLWGTVPILVWNSLYTASVWFALSLTVTLCVLIFPVRIILEILESMLYLDAFCSAVDLIRAAKAVAALLLEATGMGPASFPSLPPATTKLFTASCFNFTEIWFSLQQRPGSTSALAVSAKPAIERTLMLPDTDEIHKQLCSS